MIGKTSVRFAAACAATLAGLACGGAVDMSCTPYAAPDQLAERASAYDSVSVIVGTAEAKVCYSRPRVRGRLVFGGLVPYDTLWRTGANEPTIIHLSADATIAGIPVEAGSYSLYTVPGTEQWSLVVNASTSQWGLTADVLAPDGSVQNANSYTAEVRAQEVGRASIGTETHGYTEEFTAGFGPPEAGSVDLYFDWAAKRIVIPIQIGGSP